MTKRAPKSEPVLPGRSLPHSPEAEAAVLGAVLLDPACIEAVAAVLELEDFYVPRNRSVFGTMLALRAAGTPIDIVTLVNRLGETKRLDHVGASYVAGLLDAVPTSAGLGHYARIVRAKADLRALMDACDFVEHAAGEGGDADAVFCLARMRLGPVFKRRPA